MDELYKWFNESWSIEKCFLSHCFLKKTQPCPIRHGRKEPASFFDYLTLAEDTANSENRALFYVGFILIKHQLWLSCSTAPSTWRSQRASKSINEPSTANPVRVWGGIITLIKNIQRKVVGKPSKPARDNGELLAWFVEIMSTHKSCCCLYRVQCKGGSIWAPPDTAVCSFSSEHLKAWHQQANIVSATADLWDGPEPLSGMKFWSPTTEMIPFQSEFCQLKCLSECLKGSCGMMWLWWGCEQGLLLVKSIDDTKMN